MKLRLTSKQIVKCADPTARVDFYESLRGSDRPCWFIRSGFQGPIRSEICASPRAAWRDAAGRALEQFSQLAKAVQQ
jgi:hypothetical protein